MVMEFEFQTSTSSREKTLNVAQQPIHPSIHSGTIIWATKESELKAKWIFAGPHFTRQEIKPGSISKVFQLL